MNTPTPSEFDRCTYCGQPVHEWQGLLTSKRKGSPHWNYAHVDCAYKKSKPAEVEK